MQTLTLPFASPLLDHCPPTLPARAYLEPAWYEQERSAIWGRHWIHIGRLSNFPLRTVRRLAFGGQSVIVARDADGALSAFHNTCRHRGAELLSADETRLKSKLISCPYHQWSYALDGRLVRTPFVSVTPDFCRDDHALFPVHLREWRGFLFASLADEPPPLEQAFDPAPDALDNWPLEDLVVGHVMVKEIACNWKIFWENYNECLHCPGIHPELIDMVPVYAEGVMSPAETTGYDGPTLKPGAMTWTPDGQPCGPEFPGLTAEERAAGFTFVTLYPTLYVVAHVDYVRAVRLEALSPTTTRLTAEWLFAPETLSQPGFDAVHVASFAQTVLDQDAAAAEMNQRGLASPAFTRGTLMPQEFDLHRFHHWVMARLGKDTP